jgi:hypothetical protein
MTDLLIRDPNDTGDIPHPDLVDTHVLDTGETTQAIRPYELDYPALRRSDATVEQTVRFALPSEAVTEEIQGPQSPPPPIPPNPGPVLPPRPKGWLRRLGYVGQHRADRSYRWSVR